jgi:hypothetical protein
MGFGDFLNKARTGIRKTLDVGGHILKRVGDVAGKASRTVGSIAGAIAPGVSGLLASNPETAALAPLVNKGAEFLKNGGLDKVSGALHLAGNAVQGAGRVFGE